MHILSFRPALAVALWGCALSSHAQLVVDERQLWDQRLFEMESIEEMERPLQFKVYGSFRHDSNLFRLSDDEDPQSAIGSADKSDNIYQLGAGARLALQKSRQKFTVDGDVEQNWFQNFGSLDNTSNRLRGEWAWQAGNDWDGTLGAGHRTYLDSFTDIQGNIKDMIDRNRAYGTANYRPVSYLRFTLDADWIESEHGAESRQILDNTQESAAFTASWVTPSENALGLSVRKTEARYPNAFVTPGAPEGGDYEDEEYSVVGKWQVTAASAFRGRLGHTTREFDQGQNRDFSGPTWRLGYEWEPTAKTALEIAIWRELYGFEDLSGNYVRTTGVGLFPAWSVVPKLVLQARLLYQTRDYLGVPADPAATEAREDQERMAQLAAIWTPLRLTKVIFMAETGNRDSNQAFADYDYYSFGIGLMRIF
jgi:exopolysaccharide biosynthesis operon protein EpsL